MLPRCRSDLDPTAGETGGFNLERAIQRLISRQDAETQRDELIANFIPKVVAGGFPNPTFSAP